MWTRRIMYLTDKKQLEEYLEKMYYFHDYIIGSFTYDSSKQKIVLTIEEDHTSIDKTNAPAMIWDLECQGVSDFLMDDMDGLSKWWIYEILFEGNNCKFQLVNGYFSFKTESVSLGIPQELSQSSVPKVFKLQLDYLLQEFKRGMNVDETSFTFEKDTQDILRYIGYKENETLPYWSGLSDLPEGKRFKTAGELFDAKIYDGKSLNERWDEVTIYSINGLPLDDWLSCVPHSVETHVYESEEESGLFINGVELDGFIDEDSFCPSCGANQCHLDLYDEYCCPYCNLWMQEDWWDKDDVHYFEKRPLEPALLWKPNKSLNFCSVQYYQDGKSYTYYCPDTSIEAGDWVLVPVGKANIEKEAQVIEVFQAPANRAPFPLDKIKTVGKKLKSLTEEISETVESLLSKGVICDISQEKIPSDSSLAHDILKTPIGYFWLELNGQPIKMTILAQYPEPDEQYFVEGFYYIKPAQADFTEFQQLKLCTDVNFRKARLIDNLSGEHKEGYNWQLDDKDIGIVAHPYSYMETEVDETPLGLPYYTEWYDEYKHLYGFSVAWKYYESDEDLSVDFKV